MSQIDINGVTVFPGALDRRLQEEIVDEISALMIESPLFFPVMPRTGKAFSVRMSNLGQLGWVSDKSGYRYQDTHPVTGQPWPKIPDQLQSLYKKWTGSEHKVQACLVNYYDGKAKMGLHRDEDEGDLRAPILSISLGDTAVFRVGGANRKDKTASIRLQSGDIAIIGGRARLFYHGVDRIIPGSSTLLKNGGRLNLTLRRVSL